MHPRPPGKNRRRVQKCDGVAIAVLLLSLASACTQTSSPGSDTNTPNMNSPEGRGAVEDCPNPDQRNGETQDCPDDSRSFDRPHKPVPPSADPPAGSSPEEPPAPAPSR
jgi:hypothetical protein